MQAKSFKIGKQLMIALFLVLFLIPQAASAESWAGKMIPPVYGAEISSDYWDKRSDHQTGYHGGIDYAAPGGTPVYAVADGYVEWAAETDGFGPAVYIKHHDDVKGDFYSVYGHLQAGSLHGVGQVTQGDIIGLVGYGELGNSSGEHLHFDFQYGMMKGAEKIEPWYFIPNLGGAGDPPSGFFNPAKKLLWDATYDFGSTVKDFTDELVNFSTKAIKLLKDAIFSIFMILITIDLVYGAAMLALDAEEGAGIWNWALHKFLLYGILLYILENWAPLMGNLIRDFYVSMGAGVVGGTAEQAADIISNPYHLIQKGATIVSPMIEDMLTLHLPINLFSIVGNASKIMLFIPLLLGIIVVFGLLIIITAQIVIAYVEFYLVLAFSFVMFVLSGAKQTRHFAARCVNGIFAVSVKLMFFCIFALMLETVMADFSNDPIMETKSSAAITNAERNAMGGNFGGEEGLDAFAAAVARVETGNDYYKYNSDIIDGETEYEGPQHGSGAYGIYQFCGYYDDWAKEYENDHPNGPRLILAEDGDPLMARHNSPNHLAGVAGTLSGNVSIYSYIPENQDKVGKYRMLKTFRESGGNWRAVAAAWFGADSDEYWGKVCNAAVGGKPELIAMINFMVLFKLILVILMFMFMGDRVGKSLVRVFGQPGFKFAENDRK